MRRPSAQFLLPFISQERTLNSASLSSQKRVFEVLSNLLQNNQEKVSSDLIYQKLFERERIGSTMIGQGIVIPHCRIDKLSITRLAIVTLTAPITYDGNLQTADIFIAAIFPQDVQNIHILFMSRLVKFLKSQGKVDQIRQAASNEALYQAFTEHYA